MSRRSSATRLCLSALSLSLALAAASPAGAGTEFLGGGYLIPREDTCAEYGWTGTHQVLARMAPQGAPGNPEDETQIALLLATGTIAFRYESVSSYRYTQTIHEATYVWNGPWSPEDPTMTFYYDLYGEIPDPEDTVLDELILHFDNFNEHEGCQMTAYLSLRRV